MKLSVFTIAALFIGIVAISSCKKTSTGTTNNNNTDTSQNNTKNNDTLILIASFNGALDTFPIFTQYAETPTDSSILFSGHDNQGGALFVYLKLPTGLYTPGIYNEDSLPQPDFEYQYDSAVNFVNYEGCFNINYAPYSPHQNPCIVNISSITDSSIQATFKGNVYPEMYDTSSPVAVIGHVDIRYHK
jgi:hypothetical protein